MNGNHPNELVYKASLLLKGVRLTVFCLSYFISEQIVHSADGRIPFFCMFILPAGALISLIETFRCKITLSSTGIRVRTLTRTWSVDWNEITSWKYFNSSGMFGTRFTFNVGDKTYSLLELEKCSALKHVDQMRDWIKKHVKRKDGMPALHTDGLES